MTRHFDTVCRHLLAGLLAVPACLAGTLVYTPVNPNFGGDPMNGSFLMNEAQAQNHFKDPIKQQSQLDQFRDTLERSILSRIAMDASGRLFDDKGHLKPGDFDSADFHISVVDLGNGVLRITTTDKSTGATTIFDVTDAGTGASTPTTP